MRPTLACLGVVFLIGCRNPVDHLALHPRDVRPGDTVKVVAMVSDDGHDFTISVRHRTYPMFRTADGSLETYIGLDADWKPGRYKVAVEQVGRQRQLGYQTLFVSSRTFPSEVIFLPKTKTDLPKAPHHEEALQIVVQNLNTISKGRYWSGAFDLPVKGRLRTGYGMQRKVNNTMAWPYHRGLDLAAPIGTPVIAPNAGRVVVADRFPVQGRTIILDHGQGLVTIYMHLTSLDVRPGEFVSKGEQIGTVGSDGFSTGPHLHWGIYWFGDAVDPQGWLSRTANPD